MSTFCSSNRLARLAAEDCYTVLVKRTEVIGVEDRVRERGSEVNSVKAPARVRVSELVDGEVARVKGSQTN